MPDSARCRGSHGFGEEIGPVASLHLFLSLQLSYPHARHTIWYICIETVKDLFKLFILPGSDHSVCTRCTDTSVFRGTAICANPAYLPGYRRNIPIIDPDTQDFNMGFFHLHRNLLQIG